MGSCRNFGGCCGRTLEVGFRGEDRCSVRWFLVGFGAEPFWGEWWQVSVSARMDGGGGGGQGW